MWQVTFKLIILSANSNTDIILYRSEIFINQSILFYRKMYKILLTSFLKNKELHNAKYCINFSGKLEEFFIHLASKTYYIHKGKRHAWKFIYSGFWSCWMYLHSISEKFIGFPFRAYMSEIFYSLFCIKWFKLVLKEILLSLKEITSGNVKQSIKSDFFPPCR